MSSTIPAATAHDKSPDDSQEVLRGNADALKFSKKKNMMRNTKTYLPVESVRERDVDFLLIEEMVSSSDFVDFITKQLDLPACSRVVSVERSVNDFNLGETDILVEYLSGSKRLGILIENKLDAAFQPRQFQRYDARARQYRGGGYDESYCVLIAPQSYIDRQTEFSKCLAYEKIIEYFESSELGTRAKFKIKILKIAIEKLRRGYSPKNCPPNQVFWQNYYERLSIDLPDVYMKPVGIVPAGSDWIDLKIGDLAVVHKLEKGYIELPFMNNAQKDSLEAMFDSVDVLEFRRGRRLRIRTAPLDRMRLFGEQLENIAKCMQDIDKINSVIEESK